MSETLEPKEKPGNPPPSAEKRPLDPQIEANIRMAFKRIALKAEEDVKRILLEYHVGVGSLMEWGAAGVASRVEADLLRRMGLEPERKTA